MTQAIENSDKKRAEMSKKVEDILDKNRLKTKKLAGTLSITRDALRHILDQSMDYDRIVRLITEEKIRKAENECEWNYNKGPADCYLTQCGESHNFEVGTPAEHKFDYCPFCARTIIDTSNPTTKEATEN